MTSSMASRRRSLARGTALVLLLTAAVASAQESPKPKQSAVSEETTLTYSDGPMFAFTLLPKKSKRFKAFAKRWAIIDIAQRRKLETEAIEARIAEAKKNEEANKEVIAKLEQQLRSVDGSFVNLRLLVERRDDSTQTLKLQTNPISPSDKLSDLVAATKKQLSQWQGIVYSIDKETTSKRERKAGKQVHLLEFTGTPPNATEKQYVRFELMIVSSSSGENTARRPYRVNFYQIAPAAKVDSAFKKDSQLLFKLLLWR